MAFIPFDNVIRLEPVFVQDGQYVENVLHYIVDETPEVATCEALCTSYLNWWNASARTNAPSNVSLVKIKATILETETSQGIEFTAGLPVVGGNSSPALPNNVTVAIRLLTNLRGRSYRGRIFHVGLCENAVEGNQLSSQQVTAMMSWYGDLLTLATDVDFGVLAVASRYSHKVARTVGVATPVTNIVIDPYVDSQRRRLPGRGR